MLVDKFRHRLLPLHRQHLPMAHTGIALSRSSLTNWTGRAIDLLGPVAAAQAAHVLESRVLAMDETPVKASLAERREGCARATSGRSTGRPTR